VLRAACLDRCVGAAIGNRKAWGVSLWLLYFWSYDRVVVDSCGGVVLDGCPTTCTVMIRVNGWAVLMLV
jgi:hypothetical protein